MILLTLLSFLFALRSGDAACPERDFVGCVLRLRTQRVPFDKNVLNVVFNVTSEAKLLHTCRAYSDVVPCFRDRIVRCGDEKQKRMLDEVSKMLMFFCSPFSLNRQRQFMKHGKCIGKILRLPAATGCKMGDHPLGKDLESCRSHCAKNREFVCLMKTWVSEQSVCTLVDIENKCSRDAAFFYIDLQQNVFEEQFPLICDKASEESTTATSVEKSTHQFTPFSFMTKSTTTARPTMIPRLTIPTVSPHQFNTTIIQYSTTTYSTQTPPTTTSTPATIRPTTRRPWRPWTRATTRQTVWTTRPYIYTYSTPRPYTKPPTTPAIHWLPWYLTAGRGRNLVQPSNYNQRFSIIHPVVRSPAIKNVQRAPNSVLGMDGRLRPLADAPITLQATNSARSKCLISFYSSLFALYFAMVF